MISQGVSMFSRFIEVTSPGLDILPKLRFENTLNKKTLKQAWRFF